MKPLSRQGKRGRLGLCGRGRCPVSLHSTGRWAGCWGPGWTLLRQGLAGWRGVQRLGAQPWPVQRGGGEVVRFGGEEAKSLEAPAAPGGLSPCSQVPGARATRWTGAPSLPLP